MDIEKLIADGEFPYANCIASKSGQIAGFDMIENRINVSRHVGVDDGELTYLFPMFSVDIGHATYVGGEVAAHGSGGFFYKKTEGTVEWVLMATESNPFISVDVQDARARFLTSSGFAWVVPCNNIHMTFLENREVENSA